jgi:hypothetical protein
MTHNWTKFTRDEQRTLMTLWSISRAPLMFGGHLPWNDEFTESLITNDEVLAVDQVSTANRQLFRTNDLIAWVAEVPNSPDRYLALFNASNASTNAPGATVSAELAELGFKDGATVRDLWAGKDLGTCTGTFSRDIAAHGAELFRLGPAKR